MPAPNEKWWVVARKRLKLMFWTAIAPELTILWAMRQWFGARAIAYEFRDRGWTKTHGFFIQMGGFILYDGDRPLRVLTFEMLKDLDKRGLIRFPDITEEEINDRSKGDFLSKGLVLLQTTTCAIECVARGASGLVITELEVVTLALALLSGIIFLFWWGKPLDVRCHTPVYLVTATSSPFVEGTACEHTGDSHILGGAMGQHVATIRCSGAHATLGKPDTEKAVEVDGPPMPGKNKLSLKIVWTTLTLPIQRMLHTIYDIAFSSTIPRDAFGCPHSTL